jgi:hypothetical protein
MLITGSTGFVLFNVVRQVALGGETVNATDLVPPDALFDPWRSFQVSRSISIMVALPLRRS